MSDLAEEMQTIAAVCAEGDPRLDFTVASLSVLDEAIASHAMDTEQRAKFAAYLGEVLRRQSVGGEWAYPPARQGGVQTPSIRWGKWYASPAERLDPLSNAGPDDTVVKYAEGVLAYAADPTNKTAKRLGWKTRVTTRSNWDRLREWWRCRRSGDQP